MSRPLAAALCGLLLSAAPAARAEDTPTERRSGGLIRAGWAYPAQASLTFGTIVTRLPADFDCKTTCPYRGATIQASAGMGAGELAIGYGSLVGETGRGDWLLRRVFVGYGVRMALLRTWGTSELHPDGATYWGVEGAFTISQFNITAGAFRAIHPGDDTLSWRLFGGLGWGF